MFVEAEAGAAAGRRRAHALIEGLPDRPGHCLQHGFVAVQGRRHDLLVRPPRRRLFVHTGAPRKRQWHRRKRETSLPDDVVPWLQVGAVGNAVRFNGGDNPVSQREAKRNVIGALPDKRH